MASEPSSGLSKAVEILIDEGHAWRPNCPNSGGPARMAPLDLLIVGSGYGGAVAAARLGLAKAGGKTLDIVVLERGREISPGEFPDSFGQLPGEVRIQRDDDDELIGNADAMFDLRLGKTVNVLLGNGLGGGSLINAAVVEEPDAGAWSDSRWPIALRDLRSMQAHFDVARKRLGANRIDAWPQSEPIKLATMASLAKKIDGSRHSYRTVDIAIDGAMCAMCGDCITGCNVNAKNTLPKTYLADAHQKGVRLFTGATVSHLSRPGGEAGPWHVHFVLTHAKGHASRQEEWVIRSEHVILAAGSLGSTEILLRSANPSAGLQFSQRLGQQFSCNGDMIWSGYAQTDRVNAIADPETALNARNVGPTICSMIDLRYQDHPHVIQDASIPGSLKRVFEELISTTALGYRMIKRDTEARDARQDPDAIDPDKLSRTAVYLSMGRDLGNGELVFKTDTPKANTGLRGRIQAKWGAEDETPSLSNGAPDNVCNEPVYQATEKSLQAVEALGGMLLASPTWRIGPKELLDQLSGAKRPGSTLTVHPLGGCAMSDDVRLGVVNHYGAVFSARQESPAKKDEELDWTAVHRGLYVLDGSIVPTSLGINPLLTITALAERAVIFIAGEEGWDLDTTVAATAPAVELGITPYPVDHTPQLPERSPFEFCEKMVCKIEGETKTKLAGTSLATADKLELVVNFVVGGDGLSAFLQDPQRKVPITKAFLRIHHSDNIPLLETAVAGSVDWLIEVPQDAGDKEMDGLSRYLSSRALADIAARTDLGDGTKKWLVRFINAINYFEIKLPNFVTCILGRISDRLKNIFALATHTGGQRLLTYRLASIDDAGWELKGEKTLSYAAGGNLWRSLSEMNIQLIHGKQRFDGLNFVLDWRRIFESNVFQVRAPVSGAPRNPDMWMDLASVTAFFARSVLRIHFWSFRLPEIQQRDRKRLLPTSATSSWYPLALKDWDDRKHPVQIGVTHFPSESRDPAFPPLLLIHGFGASGHQFAAPHMSTTLVQHLQNSGRDVWVVELRTSVVMNQHLPDKDAQWSLDEVAMEDIPALVRLVLEKTNSGTDAAPFEQVDILAHCIGSAMFNVAVLSGKLEKPGGGSLIRSAALLQVGPIFKVSDGNKLRGYLARFLGEGIKLDFVDSSTDQRSEDWKDVMLDRVLNTYPVPQSELQSKAERDTTHLIPVTPDNQWQANYFRSTGVFGRLFDIKNLSPEMLDSLGDLLGRTNFRTFRQILHCVLRNRLVDRFGRNVYVDAVNFRRYTTFPVRFFHGAKNDVFGKWGVVDSTCQLRGAHHWEENPELALDQSPFSWEYLADFGHLDPLIGDAAPIGAFPQFSQFLNQTFLPFKTGNASIVHSLRPPDHGPIIGWTRRVPDTSNNWVSRVWVQARETAGKPILVAVFKIVKGTPVTQSLRLFPVKNCPLFKQAVIDLVWPSGDEEIGFSVIHRGCQAGSGGGKEIEFASSELDEINATPAEETPIADADHGGALPNAREAVTLLKLYDCASFPQSQREQLLEAEITEEFYVSVTLAKSGPNKTSHESLRIALGSCRYSGTMLELLRNNDAYEKLDKVLESKQHVPAFMLLMGDQIYADATAGVADSPEVQSCISLYHRSLARGYNDTPLGAAKVFRKLPAYMMLDDHEIADNWNEADDLRRDPVQSRNDLRRTRISEAAFASFQWSHGPRSYGGPFTQNRNLVPTQGIATPKYYWYTFRHDDFDFFVLDTRLERTRIHPSGEGQIISDEQFFELKKWLGDCEKSGKPRFIVTPSAIGQFSGDHPSLGDGWWAYPSSLEKLAALLFEHKKVVILSGDRHAQGLLSLTISDTKQTPVKIPVVIASPLYAPYPFANQSERARSLSVRFGDTSILYEVASLNTEYQGFVQLVMSRQNGNTWRGDLYTVDGATALFDGSMPAYFNV